MSILIFGGAFNPPTLGHLKTAQVALNEKKFNKCVFVPTGDAPHKNNLVQFKHRLAMVNLVIKNQPDMSSDSIEGIWAITGAKSYSINTYKYFKQLYEDVWWLIGSDALYLLETWYNFPEVRKEMKFCVLTRKPNSLTDTRQKAESLGINYTIIENEVNISSTLVRECIVSNKNTRGLIDDSVLSYIQKHSLYGIQGNIC